MPLTDLQAKIAQLLATNRSPDSHLAGGAAILIDPNSERFSYDLDYFHDSIERVTGAFESDTARLRSEDFQVDITFSHPGFVQVLALKDDQSTKIEWSHDSAWRFLPAVASEQVGFQLHPIDLAVNKVLALVGRNEPRDVIDTLYVHGKTLSLGAMCWAACGKDPGLTPSLVLDLIARKGTVRPEEISKLNFRVEPDVHDLKIRWLAAIEQADSFIKAMPGDEIGCLYYSATQQRFLGQIGRIEQCSDAVPHHGQLYGVLPEMSDPGN